MATALEQLAEYLGEEVENLKATDDSGYGKCQFVECPDGREFYLYENEDDAREGAIECAKNIIEDCGLPNCEIGDFLDNNWVKELANEEANYHADEGHEYIYNEDGQTRSEVESDLTDSITDAIEDANLDASECGEKIAELVDKALEGIDFDLDEDGNSRNKVYEEEYDRVADDPIEYLKEIYSENELADYLIKQNAIDLDELAEYCVDCDGIANNLASYDGEEIDLSEGAMAFRHN